MMYKNFIKYNLAIWLIPSTMLAVHSNAGLSYIGGGFAAIFSVILFIYLCGFYVSSFSEKKIIRSPLYFMLILMLINALSSYDLNYLPGLAVRLIQLMSIISILQVFYIFGSGKNGDLYLKKFRRLFFYSSFGVTTIALIGWGGDAGLGFANPNVVGMWMGVAVIISMGLFKSSVYGFIFMSYGVIIVFLSESRTSMVALFFAVLVYIIWPFIVRTKIIFNVTLIMLFFISFCLVYFTLVDFVGLSAYNEISRDITGKNIMSGRQIIWPEVAAFVLEKPWLGWGGGSQLRNFSHLTLSAHNLYLQILLQVGVVGLTALLIFLFSIWNIFWRLSFNKDIRWAAASFIYVLLCQNFEVTLTQNNMALSWPMWCFIALIMGNASRGLRI